MVDFTGLGSFTDKSDLIVVVLHSPSCSAVFIHCTDSESLRL